MFVFRCYLNRELITRVNRPSEYEDPSDLEHAKMITKPLDTFPIYYSCSTPTAGAATAEPLVETSQMRFYFLLHKNLTLNISFHYIITSYKTTLDCRQGLIEIIDVGFGLRNSPELSYFHCGLYSKFSQLCSGSSVLFILCVASGNYIVTSLSHFVRDRGGISNDLQISAQHSEFHVGWFFYTGIKNDFLFHFMFIRGNHSQKLQICAHVQAVDVHSTSSALQVFDGPGSRCSPLSLTLTSDAMPLEYCVSASTFQATIFIQNRTKKVEYSGIAISTQKVLVTDREIHSLKIPDKQLCRLPGTCALTINADTTQHINMTLENFTYHGSDDMGDCTYAGVAVYDPIKGHTTTQCVSPQYLRWSTFDVRSRAPHSIAYEKFSNHNIFRTLLSTASILQILIFNYKAYSSLLSFSMHLKTTDCTVRMVETCSTPIRIPGSLVVLPCNSDKPFIVQFLPLVYSYYPFKLCHWQVRCSKFSKWGTEVRVTGSAVLQEGKFEWAHKCMNK